MKKHFSFLFILGVATLLPTKHLYAKEELTVIQTVSKNRRSFVVAKGIKDGVVKGQEIIFANDNVSIVCKASEVNRGFSLWVPVDATITVPFNKEDVVTSNSTVYGNVALEIVGDSNLTPGVNYNELYKKFRAQNNYTLRAGYNRSLTQSSSSVEDSQNSARAGYSLSLDYNYRFLPEFEMSFGGRLDNEVYRLEKTSLDVPTRRVMGVVAATYHFVNFSKNKNNFFLSVATGIGQSKTTLDNDEASGRVTLLPEVRFGYLMPFSKTLALSFEGSVESLSATETLTDGTETTTNLVITKLSLGLRF